MDCADLGSRKLHFPTSTDPIGGNRRPQTPSTLVYRFVSTSFDRADIYPPNCYLVASHRTYIGSGFDANAIPDWCGVVSTDVESGWLETDAARGGAMDIY